MKIVKRIFDECLILNTDIRDDQRGTMEMFYGNVLLELSVNFEVSQMRFYKMRQGAFFGIHVGPAKLLGLIAGKGIDYIVDLRVGSPTYKKWESIELSADDSKLIYLPAGFGHAFLSLAEGSIQAFAIDDRDSTIRSESINYRSPGIELKLPVEDVILADYDRDADILE